VHVLLYNSELLRDNFASWVVMMMIDDDGGRWEMMHCTTSCRVVVEIDGGAQGRAGQGGNLSRRGGRGDWC
jgi:hypothetical protein